MKRTIGPQALIRSKPISRTTEGKKVRFKIHSVNYIAVEIPGQIIYIKKKDALRLARWLMEVCTR